MAATADPTSEGRRHHLAALTYEVEARGLRCRLTGPGKGILVVLDPSSGRSLMVVAMPTARAGWSYLWGGGGLAAAADPSRAADLIAATLCR